MVEQDIQDVQDDEWIFTICTGAALPKYILPILPTLFHPPQPDLILIILDILANPHPVLSIASTVYGQGW
jgi:hypothetical protein